MSRPAPKWHVYWTPEETAELADLYAAQMPIHEIAARLGRTPRACYMHASLHGLRSPRWGGPGRKVAA